MKSIIKYFLICASLCTGFQVKSETQQHKGYADSIFEAANYSLAALEYEEIFFSSDNAVEKANALLKKSSCFKRLNEFGKASETLQRISFNELSDSLQYQVRYEHALSLLLQKKYDEAELQYIDINFYTHNESLRNQSLFLGIIIKNELRKWQEADSLFIEYIKFNNINIDSVKISELLKKPKLLNPKTAKIISYFIPGSGQIYSGHVFRGLTSIAFQGSFFTFTFLSIKNGFYFSAATTGFGIFQLIYIGGARYAYYLAEKKNAKKIETYNKKIRDFLFH